ncbi:MAG: adenosylhomocysteinase, partial [Firmicutes bacterium]|nr:adenosylhomocysteinase [Bacillota bacterium]
MKDFAIRDPGLWESGRRKIEWVRNYMPLLNALEAEFAKTKPFEGLRVSLSVHLEAKTAYLCEVFAAGGAEMAVTGSNVLSTQDDVAAALVRGNGGTNPGMSVFAVHGASQEEYERSIERVLEHRPHIIIDDGGDLVSLLHTKRPDLAECVIGGCEETTTGINRLRAMDREGIL